MAGIKAIIEVVEGPGAGRRIVFEQYGVCVVGRDHDCTFQLPEDDEAVSRYHFIIEAHPPEVRVRDLGSMNGTFVNGTRYGGRADNETPAEAQAKYQFPQVDLKDGDKIKAGRTVFAFSLEYPQRTVLIDPSNTTPIGALTSLMLQAGLVPDNQQDAVPGFQIIRQIGAGASGMVYLARRVKDDLQIALKIMLAKAVYDEKLKVYFMREIKILSKLSHRNIVSLLEAGSTGGGFYFAMEYCDSESVGHLLKRKGGRLTVDEALPLVLDALEGLAYAHARGYVHRDINPGNILLTKSVGGVIAKLADFGLSKSFERAGFSGFTLTGVVGGTLPYMPREQLLDFRMSKPSCDVWSMGATLYKMLTDATPLDFAQGADPLGVIMRNKLIPVGARGIPLPSRIAAIIDTATAADPDKRFQNAGQMLKALREARPSQAF